MTAYIYKITNTVNDKSYIGFTTNVEKRIFEHFSHKRLRPKYVLGKAIRKHNRNDFTLQILYESSDEYHTLNVMEPLYIALYNTHYVDGNGYNMTYGGDGVTHTEDSRKRIGAAAKARLQHKNNGAEATKVEYIITYESGVQERVKGITQFCKDRNYSRRSLKAMMYEDQKKHKDIIKIERVE